MADKHFLDYDGLSQFFNGLKQKFYQKPSSGIPKSDLESSVQDSLGRADSALQSHQDISGKLDKSGGTMSGALNMGSKKITSLATPTSNTDAATKKYVDDKSHTHSNKSVIDNITSEKVQTWDNALSTTGGTMTGAISMSSKNIGMLGDPTQDYDAANKKYVDDTIGKKLVIGTRPPSDTTALWVCTIDYKIKCYDTASSSWIQANPIDNGSITTAKIANGAVDTSKLSSSVQNSLTNADQALPITGGVLSGSLTMDDHEIIFAYSDSAISRIEPGKSTDTEPNLVLTGLKVNPQTGVSTDANVILKGVATPVNNTDAANKAYVDNKVSQSGHTHSNKTVLDGITSDKVSSWDAKATTSYVDTAVSNKATTSYVDTAISTAVASAVVYKGTKAAVANLPSTGNKTGDMWNVSADGMNYVWDGSKWDAQAPTFSITAITTAEINTILASTT